MVYNTIYKSILKTKKTDQISMVTVAYNTVELDDRLVLVDTAVFEEEEAPIQLGHGIEQTSCVQNPMLKTSLAS